MRHSAGYRKIIVNRGWTALLKSSIPACSAGWPASGVRQPIV